MFLTNILAHFGVTGNFNALLLFSVLRIFFICSVKSKWRLNLPFLKSRLRNIKIMCHCVLTNILPYLGVAGNANVLLLFRVLHIFCIHYLKPKWRLHLPFLKSKGLLNTNVPLCSTSELQETSKCFSCSEYFVFSTSFLWKPNGGSIYLSWEEEEECKTQWNLVFRLVLWHTSELQEISRSFSSPACSVANGAFLWRKGRRDSVSNP